MKPRISVPGLLAAAAVLCLSGCTAEPEMPKEELGAKTELNTMAQQAFAQKQTWESIPQAHRDAYIKFYKDEDKAKESFQKAYDGMKYFFGGGAPGQPQAPQ